MASLRREIRLANSAARVWDAIRDFHAVATRVAPGFLKKSVPDGHARIVTFTNGLEAREDLVSSDDATRRLVYAISNARLPHYNAALEIFASDDKNCRVIWTVDLMPDAMATQIGEQMDAAIKVMKPTLERT